MYKSIVFDLGGVCLLYTSAHRGLSAGVAAAVSGVAAAGLGVPLSAAVHAGHGGAGPVSYTHLDVYKRQMRS